MKKKNIYTVCVHNGVFHADDVICVSLLRFVCGSENVMVISDDYTIQNTLKIMDIPYSGVITEGIKGVYNWKKVCEGCKKEYGEDYPFDDCEICGSKIYKKRIKVDK